MNKILRVIEKIENKITTQVLHELKTAEQLNIQLVGGLEPGHSCVLRLHQTCKEFVEFLIKEAILNTHEYRSIDWTKRANIIDKAIENVQDEAVTLQSQINEFLRDAVKDIHRLGHVGFGLQNAPIEHPRYQNFIYECKSAIEYYKKPEWAHENGPASASESTPPPYTPEPHVAPPPSYTPNSNVMFLRRQPTTRQVYQRADPMALSPLRYSHKPKGVVTRPRK